MEQNIKSIITAGIFVNIALFLICLVAMFLPAFFPSLLSQFPGYAFAIAPISAFAINIVFFVRLYRALFKHMKDSHT